eukprot:9494326-Pyramimonas_sp.AAC.1
MNASCLCQGSVEVESLSMFMCECVGPKLLHVHASACSNPLRRCECLVQCCSLRYHRTTACSRESEGRQEVGFATVRVAVSEDAIHHGEDA